MKRILLGNRSSSSLGVAVATLQLGHSKSPYSTSVTRACSEPSRWSVGSGGTARLIEWDCVLISSDSWILTRRAWAVRWAGFSHESHSIGAATASLIHSRSNWSRAGVAARRSRLRELHLAQSSDPRF